jgi:hypothetical protein
MLLVYEYELDFLYTWKYAMVSGRQGLAHKFLLRLGANPHFRCYSLIKRFHSHKY